jgi:protein-disulfide isomerase
MNKNVLVVTAGVLAVAVFLVGTLFYKQEKAAEVSKVAQDNSAALIRPHSPVFGNEQAKVTIVEFLDPACETCRAFYPHVKSIVMASFGQVKLVIRYAPLHQGSDQAVKILEAARMQKDMYWPVMEAALQSQPDWASHHNPQPDLIWEHVKTTGLDIAKAKSDLNDPSIQKILDQDIADRLALKINKTPSFFVNGKPLSEFGLDQLKQLVKQELMLAYGQ